MRRVRESRVGRGAAVAVLIVLAGCSLVLVGETSATATRPHMRTQVTIVSPISANGLAPDYRVTAVEHSHSSFTGSEVGAGGLSRCFAKQTLDPCWPAPSNPTHTMLCLRRPQDHSLIEVRTTDATAPSVRRPVDIHEEGAWGIQIAGGQRAIISQGAHDTYQRMPIDYEFGYRSEGVLHLVSGGLRGIDRSQQPWTVRVASYDESRNRFLRPREVAIARAWFASGEPSAGTSAGHALPFTGAPLLGEAIIGCLLMCVGAGLLRLVKPEN